MTTLKRPALVAPLLPPHVEGFTFPPIPTFWFRTTNRPLSSRGLWLYVERRAFDCSSESICLDSDPPRKGLKSSLSLMSMLTRLFFPPKSAAFQFPPRPTLWSRATPLPLSPAPFPRLDSRDPKSFLFFATRESHFQHPVDAQALDGSRTGLCCRHAPSSHRRPCPLESSCRYFGLLAFSIFFEMSRQFRFRVRVPWVLSLRSFLSSPTPPRKNTSLSPT